MTRRARTVLYASALGLSALHCGARSTPPSSTPAPSEASPAESEEMRGESPASERQPDLGPGAGSSSVGSELERREGAEEWEGERMPMAGSDEPSVGGEMEAGTLGAMGGPAGALNDGQVAAITDLVSTSEIQEAQLAQAKSQSPQVVNYAAMILHDHGLQRQRQAALGVSAVSSPLSQMLSTQGQQALATLEAQSGSDFDQAYLLMQIEEHQRTLDTIDRQLLPSATNPRLREHLQEMRTMIEKHLQTARDAQQSLQSSSGESPAGTEW